MPLKPFLDAIDERVLVCDGAMGTQLYAKGVFINRCFESLNLTNADLVGGVHAEYVRAGADIIETNTFGANRIKLRAFGLSEKVTDINREGARIARQAANDKAYVAGAIGPLGIRVEPWGKTGVDEAEQYFTEQAEALVAGGVDLFVLETFRDLNEISAAIAAVRRICRLPIVAQMTTEEDGNSLDGTPPEQFAPVLLARGADVDESTLAALVWLEQKSPGTFVRHSLAIGFPRHASLDVGDIDADGDIDIVVGQFSMDKPTGGWVDVWVNGSKTPGVQP